MAQSFEFSILQAVPDKRRGERVNVGVVVFLPDRLDVRLPESRKLKALTGHSWEDVGQAYAEQISRHFSGSARPEEMLSSFGFFSDTFEPSDIGTMTIESPSDYEDRIRSILDNLVLRPQKIR